MRYVFGFLCVCALGVMHLVGCGEDGGGGECADWAGDWTVTSISCDDVAANTPDIEFRVAVDCSGEATIIDPSDACTVTNQLTVTRETGDTTTLDTGTVTCSAECTPDECQPLADGAMPYSATLIVTDDTWTLTALTTQQMVADEVTPCEVGETMVTVAVPK